MKIMLFPFFRCVRAHFKIWYTVVSAGQIYMYLTKRGKPDLLSLRFVDGLVFRLTKLSLESVPLWGRIS